jgi:hypothetical protein
MDAADIITQGVAAAGFAKVLVELVKLSPIPAARSALPILAFFFSEGCAFLLAATKATTVFDRPTIAIVVLVGISATAGAIGLTALQSKADRVEERVETALELPSGSTKSDVDKAIVKSDEGK